MEIFVQHPHLAKILTEVRYHLEIFYGDRLSSLLLYGSQAKNEVHNDSDIDILVALHEPFDCVRNDTIAHQFYRQLGAAKGAVISTIKQRLLDAIDRASTPSRTRLDYPFDSLRA